MVNKKKAQSKKQQKRGGVDFKKIKRKIGRKLPPPKNTTNTEIKSKAIILPEQSVAAEKTGLAVSKKGLTLKELLQQTSHHNAKVRRDALIGIRDIFLKHPAELKLHKLPAIEKLRERICDDDKLVRETLYQLFKKVVLPSCKSDQDNPVSFISLMMLYIFNAMTHLAIDVRVMAFKFLDLVVQNYPSSFLSYSEKILQNFEDILRKSQFQLQDQSKLESILAGLVHCLALLPSNKRVDDSTIENEDPQPRLLHTSGSDAIKNSSEISGLTERLKDLLPILVGCFSDAQSFDCKLFILESIDLGVKFFVHETQKSQKCTYYDLHLYGKRPDTASCNPILSSAIFKKLWNVFPLKGDKRHFVLNAIIAEIFLRLSEWDCPNPDLLENFLGFLESSLTEKISNNSKGSGEAFHKKHLLPLIPFIPKLGLRIGEDWRSRILKAFNEVFKNSSPESTLKLACLSVLEEILDQENGWGSLFASHPEMLHYLGIWTNELPLLLVSLDDKHPECSKAVLHLQLNLGKTAMLNVSFTQNYDQLQDKFKDFYSTSLDEKVSCGPFIRLTRDIQELSLSCLCYFSALHSPLLQSLASCCLSPDMEPSLLLRIIEVLQSTYKAGNVPTINYISFLITLLSRFKVYPEDMHPIKGPEGTSNRETFRSLCNVVRSSLSSIGDEYVVLQMLEKTILDQMSLKLPVDNICGFLRVLKTLDSKPTRLSEENIIKLSHVLPEYLIHMITSCVQDDHVPKAVEKINSSSYYILPCFFLFDRSSKLLHLFLNSLKSLIAEEVLLPVPHHTRSAVNCSNNIYSILFLLLLMYEDIKMERILLPHKTHIKSITEEVAKLQSSGQLSISIEESHKIKTALTRLESKLADR